MNRRVLVLLVFLLLVGAAYLVLRDRLSVAALVEQERRLRAMLDAHPILSLGGGFFVYFAASLVPGTTGKSIIYGWLFGFWSGLVLVNCGLTAAAVLTFFFIRYLFYEPIHLRLGGLIRRIDAALQRDGPVYLLSLRLLHAPFTLTNYAAGATAVRARTFWWTTHLGLLPGNVAFVLAGSQLPSLETMKRQGIMSLVNFPLLIGLTVAAFLPVGVRAAIRHWRGDTGLPSPEEPTADGERRE